ncbi:hypothetical protein B0T21DRAFT_353511 [Apiosordaria backusii]|uniref:Uncharacterized protein n=1 Tax=Apiosordaria backusii TaxID=314023 RepID=A0AA39ZRX5_9PEZI|nr:hypothetical protein B0T21DRAFT_353511 [Apiosordaria backusii]
MPHPQRRTDRSTPPPPPGRLHRKGSIGDGNFNSAAFVLSERGDGDGGQLEHEPSIARAASKHCQVVSEGLGREFVKPLRNFVPSRIPYPTSNLEGLSWLMLAAKETLDVNKSCMATIFPLNGDTLGSFFCFLWSFPSSTSRYMGPRGTSRRVYLA